MKIQRYNPQAKGGQFGIISGEPGDIYHANPAISNSDLSLFLNDPKRFEAKLKDELEEKDSKALLLGDIFHTRCLESVEVFDKRFVLDSNAPPRPTKAQHEAHEKYVNNFICVESPPIKAPTKAQMDAQLKRHDVIRKYENFWKVHKGKKEIKFSDFEAANNMRDALFSDPDAAALLDGFEGMHKELTLRTEELQLGFSVQSKLDIFDEQNGAVFDLKKISDLYNCKINTKKFGYYRQAAFYMTTFEWMFGQPPERFFFLFVEDQHPHEVAVFEVDKSSREYISGLNQIKKGLELLSQCLDSGKYPKRFPGIQKFEFSEWDLKDAESRLERIARSEESEVAA